MYVATMLVPGCMWHVMHWLEGMERVKACLRGWPGSSRGIVVSADCVRPRLPNWA